MTSFAKNSINVAITLSVINVATAAPSACQYVTITKFRTKNNVFAFLDIGDYEVKVDWL